MMKFLIIAVIFCSTASTAPVTMDYRESLLLSQHPPIDFHETNPNTTKYGPLIEGDIIFTTEDRKGVAQNLLWQNRHYRYEIASGAESKRWAINNGISFWRDHTCVQFEEVTAGSSSQARVRFISESGCWSHVGNTAQYSSGKVQELSIGDGCTSLGTVTHEIGHSLGFYHEQSRSDRDQYVYIVNGNIQSGKEYNFRRTSSENHGVKYDYSSVMHYGGTFFSSNGQKTIVTKDPTKQSLLGNRQKPTFRDVKLMNVLYRCSELCSSPPSCLNGGYIDAQCVCRCPPNTSGPDCAVTSGDYYPDPGCGGIVTQPSQITSPNWPAVYPKELDCTWWIQAPQGKKARLECPQFGIFSRFYNGCYGDVVEIRTGGITSGTTEYCGTELQNQPIVADGPNGDLIARFKSGSFDWGSNSGFECNISFI